MGRKQNEARDAPLREAVACAHSSGAEGDRGSSNSSFLDDSLLCTRPTRCKSQDFKRSRPSWSVGYNSRHRVDCNTQADAYHLLGASAFNHLSPHPVGDVQNYTRGSKGNATGCKLSTAAAMQSLDYLLTASSLQIEVFCEAVPKTAEVGRREGCSGADRQVTQKRLADATSLPRSPRHSAELSGPLCRWQVHGDDMA